MVSFQAPLETIKDLENSTKKRKWEEEEEAVEELLEIKPLVVSSTKSKSPRSMFNTELLLQLETPLPLEWQRCLDIKSGQIHYYNMRTQTRTSNDPRTTNSVADDPPPPPPPPYMSLDLELNLPCGSPITITKTLCSAPHSPTKAITTTTTTGDSDTFPNWSKNRGADNPGGGRGIPRCPSWLAFGGDEREMITAACRKCYMLVMMCKSSPVCPNCKFLHPPDQTLPTNLFFNKSGLSLSC